MTALSTFIGRALKMQYQKHLKSTEITAIPSLMASSESVNDTYLDAWNSIPPHRPSILSTFLGKITRRISIDKWRGRTAKKRGGGEIVLVLDELSDCIPSNQNVEHEVEAAELVQLIDSFVMSLSPMERRVFICRYWYFDPISEIAQRFGFSQSKVKMMLHRQRKNLLNRLEREEFL